MSQPTGIILVVDDDDDVLLAARLLLKQDGYRVWTTPDPQRLPALLEEEAYDVILLDMNFTRDASSGREGFYWLKTIRELDPSAVVVMITAYGDVEMAVQAMKEGATDFVLKPWQNEKLLATLSSAVQLRQSRHETTVLRSRQKQLSTDLDQPFHTLIGQSSAMQSLLKTIEKVAGTNVNVLILGENGSGKELVAREIHRQSPRAHEVFLSVDMGALSETLFDSELFGHVKGAFTDAKAERAGRFELASGGTLFLDEIGNLSLPLQAKLLSVLQNTQVTRLGSNKAIPIDIRLICATNVPLYDMVVQQQFRQDLLYRINTVELHVPPLRERAEDIPLLIDYYIAVSAQKYHKPHKRVSVAAHRMLASYPWPGNVRELQHAVERALIMSDAAELHPDDFFLPEPTVRIAEEVVLADYNLEEVEKQVIRNALSKHGGNISRTAKALGLTRAALYRRMEKHDL